MTKRIRSLNFALILILVLATSFINTLSSQEEVLVDSLKESAIVLTNEYTRDGYSENTLMVNTGAISTRSNGTFNQGVINDPLLLLQGRIPGVQIYNRGGDPNQTSLVRIRGVSGFSQNRLPLIVIDGIAGAKLENVDPNDIASITVLKDAASQAIYGIRGANGVVLINTKTTDLSKDGINLQYNGQVATSSLIEGASVFTGDEFRAAGGFDLGSSTNWMEEITQMGTSFTHGLSIAGKKGKNTYRVSGNYRNIEGVLRNSGFKKYNLRLNYNRSAFQDKLNISIHAAYSSNDRQIGFTEAFRYALSFNPTAPVDAQGLPFPFNTEQYGGFYENLGLYDSQNPLAIVDLNQKYGLQQTFTSSVHLDYSLGEQANLNFRYTFQNDFSNQRTFYSPQSYYRGNAFSPLMENKGSALLSDIDDDFSLYELYYNLSKNLGNSKLNFTLGTSYHDGRYDEDFLRLSGFTNSNQLTTDRIGNLQRFTNNALTFDTIRNGWNDLLLNVFSRANLNIKDKVFLDASMRYEGSSKLGDDNKWGLFPAVGVAFAFGEIWDMTAVDAFNLRLGYGVTGGIPFRGGLSKKQTRLVQQPDSTIIVVEDRLANSSLKWEQKNEFNVGLDFRKGNFSASIDWYNKRLKDWIYLDYNPELLNNQYTNQYELQSSGLEASLNLVLLNEKNTKISTGLILATYQSKYENVGPDPRLAISPGGIIQNPLLVIENGGAYGAVHGLQYTGAVEDGFPVFADVNGDGSIVTAASLFNNGGDFTNLGNGAPTLELGWNAQVEFKGWQLATFFRGAFGHVLVNRLRQYQEPEINAPVLYNRMATDLFIPGLQRQIFSSIYVEKADFFKLDNITLAKTFILNGAERTKRIRISLTGQNLLVFTNYTGANPEPALEDTGTFFPYSATIPPAPNNPLGAGIDRRSSYLPNKTVVLGVGLGF